MPRQSGKSCSRIAGRAAISAAPAGPAEHRQPIADPLLDIRRERRQQRCNHPVLKAPALLLVDEDLIHDPRRELILPSLRIAWIAACRGLGHILGSHVMHRVARGRTPSARIEPPCQPPCLRSGRPARSIHPACGPVICTFACPRCRRMLSGSTAEAGSAACDTTHAFPKSGLVIPAAPGQAGAEIAEGGARMIRSAIGHSAR